MYLLPTTLNAYSPVYDDWSVGLSRQFAVVFDCNLQNSLSVKKWMRDNEPFLALFLHTVFWVPQELDGY